MIAVHAVSFNDIYYMTGNVIGVRKLISHENILRTLKYINQLFYTCMYAIGG